MEVAPSAGDEDDNDEDAWDTRGSHKKVMGYHNGTASGPGNYDICYQTSSYRSFEYAENNIHPDAPQAPDPHAM